MEFNPIDSDEEDDMVGALVYSYSHTAQLRFESGLVARAFDGATAARANCAAEPLYCEEECIVNPQEPIVQSLPDTVKSAALNKQGIARISPKEDRVHSCNEGIRRFYATKVHEAIEDRATRRKLEGLTTLPGAMNSMEDQYKNKEGAAISSPKNNGVYSCNQGIIRKYDVTSKLVQDVLKNYLKRRKLGGLATLPSALNSTEEQCKDPLVIREEDNSLNPFKNIETRLALPSDGNHAREPSNSNQKPTWLATLPSALNSTEEQCKDPLVIREEDNSLNPFKNIGTRLALPSDGNHARETSNSNQKPTFACSKKLNDDVATEAERFIITCFCIGCPKEGSGDWGYCSDHRRCVYKGCVDDARTNKGFCRKHRKMGLRF